MKYAPILFLTVLLSMPVFLGRQSADLILFNGKVFTADPASPAAEAIAISGDRIIAVGSSSEIQKLVGATTRRIDLQNRIVVPGFNDAHFHFEPEPNGFQLQFESLEPTWEHASAALQQAITKVPAGTWIFGTVGYKVVLNPDVTRFVLDRLAPDHPVLLRTYYGHGYMLNSKAMPLLQISEEEPDPAGGYYERVAGSKRINGRLWEYAEWKPNRVLADQVSDEEAIKQLRQMANGAIRFGVTSMQVFPRTSVDRFARLAARADLAIRLRAIPFSMTTPQGRDLSEIRKLSSLSFPGSKVTASGMKWVLDGTPFERGAALRQPYADQPGWSGKLNFNEGEIAAMVRESLDLKQQLLVHCAGDKSAAVVLDSMEKVGGSKVDWRAHRLRIEHGDGLIDDLIPRARRLGVLVVQNPTHFSEPALFHQRWGTRMQPLRSLIDAGIPVAIGSDGPMNPYLNLMLAILHPYNPPEAINREQAVRAYTYGSAFAEFAESEKGMLGKGKLADLVVLSQDIFSVPPPELPKTVSLLTIVGGKIVYDAHALK